MAGSFLKNLNETWAKNAKAPSPETLQVLDRLRGICAILDTLDIDSPEEFTPEEFLKIREVKVQAGMAIMYLPDEETPEVIYLKRILEDIMRGPERNTKPS